MPKEAEMLEIVSDEFRLRCAALEVRLRLERLANQYLELAHPYIECDEKRIWRPADILKFLEDEIDPDVLESRSVAIPEETPMSEKPIQADSEKLSPTEIGVTATIDVKELNKLWQKMGSMLHYPPENLDIVKAEKTILDAKSYLSGIETGLILVVGSNETITIVCGAGHATKRLTNRLKLDKVIDCSNLQFKRSFMVKNVDGRLTPVEVLLTMKCVNCKEQADLIVRKYTNIDYWHKAIFNCEKCGHQNMIQWVLSHAT